MFGICCKISAKIAISEGNQVVLRVNRVGRVGRGGDKVQRSAFHFLPEFFTLSPMEYSPQTELANTVFLASVNHSDDLQKLKNLIGKRCILSDSGKNTLVEVVAFSKEAKRIGCVLKMVWEKIYDSRQGKFTAEPKKMSKRIKISANMDFGTCSVVLQADDSMTNQYLVFTTGYTTSRLIFIPALLQQFLEEDEGWYERLWEEYEF